MAYIYKNPNPLKKRVGDCVVRGVSILTDKSWVYSYICIVVQGLKMYDMPSSNEVWGSYLKSLGYKKYIIPDSCPDCYTIKDFCFTPQAVDELGNVTSTCIITVPRGCCFSLSVRYVDATVDNAAVTPTPTIEVQNSNLVIDRIA